MAPLMPVAASKTLKVQMSDDLPAAEEKKLTPAEHQQSCFMSAEIRF
jgi:hypothetical protein